MKSWIIDVSKYGKLTGQAKELLYRPDKVKILYYKYWDVSRVAGQRFTTGSLPKSRAIVTKPRYPPKNAEEQALITKVLDKLNELIYEDNKVLER